MVNVYVDCANSFFFIYFIADVTIAVTYICNILCSHNTFFLIHEGLISKVPRSSADVYYQIFYI